jgi:hypothetical protein
VVKQMGKLTGHLSNKLPIKKRILEYRVSDAK